MTNKETGLHVHDDLSLEKKAIDIENKVNIILDSDKKIIDSIDNNNLDERDKAKQIRQHQIKDQIPPQNSTTPQSTSSTDKKT